MKSPLLLLSCFWLFLGEAIASPVAAASIRTTRPKAIYNTDSRVEVRDYPDGRIRQYADSVAGMVRNFRLLDRDPNLAMPSQADLVRQLEQMIFSLDSMAERQMDQLIKRMSDQQMEEFRLRMSENQNYFFFDTGRTLRRNMNVCEGERFVEQPLLPDCTGFLIAPDLLATAGHCVETQFQCRNFKWVFGYTEGTTRIKREDVYGCKEIIAQDLAQVQFVTRDYAIIRLDRPVEDREPLPVRLEGWARVGTDLAVIGHPSGLPMKVADEAKIRSSRINFFYTDLDTFSGNSGSPVINQETGIVEGILVEGEEDYEFSSARRCYLPKRFNSTERSAAQEKVFRMNRIPNLEEILF